MIEGAADEISEEVLRDALVFADRYVTAQVEAVRDLVARAGKPKRSPKLFVVSDEVRNAVAEAAGERLQAACMIHAKQERYDALDALCAEVSAELAGRFTDADGKEPNFKAAFDEVTEASVRRLILDQGMRSDGRRADEIRPLSCEAGVLPCVHGSALFSRGETQALVTITLGPEKDSQSFDAITGGESSKSFFLHYNFPNFSVGETGRIMGPGRREIGHGALAERAVAGMIPEDFQYAVRCVSDILGSNGSSSMASVCGASLALMDAGVPLKKPVAGISVGLVTEESGDRKVLLTDILGSEDHYGDMDFKLTGTSDGITAFQLDLKIAGLDIDSMYEAMKANRLAREQILSAMGSCLSAPRSELNPNAPRVHALHINPEKIGALIGPGGKVIRGITERTGANIDVQSDGTVLVFVSNAKTLEAAVHEIESVTAEAEIGKIYRGEVKTVREFGAFVEFLPGQDGLLHVSEMADYRVNNVEEICKVGDFVTVKVIDIDDRGRVRLSRKEALADLD
jgi:polyribonucleotide nucleotidyltransferase